MSAGNVDPKVIPSIAPTLLKTLPAGPAPPGVLPNFVDPPTQVPAILGVGIAFLVLAVFCFSLHIYTKLAVAKDWKWDDLTCSLGFLFSIVHFGVVVNGCVNGAAGRHQWDMYLDKILGNANICQSYVTGITITPGLGLIKFSLFIQYYLLFRPLRWIRIGVWIGGTMSAIFYIVVTITAFVLCSPWPGQSLLENLLSWHYLKFADFSIPTGVIGMLVDWYLLILPIPAVVTLQMSKVKKLGILIKFMTGGLAAIASTISLYYRIKLEENISDLTWYIGYVLMWAQIEMFAGVAASSMPTVKQFFSRHEFSFTSWRSSLKSSLTHLLSTSAREKLTDDSASSRGWGASRTHTSGNRDRFRLADLEWGGGERRAAKTLGFGDTQIRLTQPISVVQEEMDDSVLRPTGRHY